MADFIFVPFFQEKTSENLKSMFHYGYLLLQFLQQQLIILLQKRKCLETTVFLQDAASLHLARTLMALFRPL